MITALPAKISTVHEAQRFLLDLHSNAESFHPEDSALDIIWTSAEVSTAEREQLDKLMKDIYSLPGFDPCEYLYGLQHQQHYPPAKIKLSEYQRSYIENFIVRWNADREQVFLEDMCKEFQSWLKLQQLPELAAEDLLYSRF